MTRPGQPDCDPRSARGDSGATHRRALHLVFAIMEALHCVVTPADRGAGDPLAVALRRTTPGDARGRECASICCCRHRDSARGCRNWSHKNQNVPVYVCVWM